MNKLLLVLALALTTGCQDKEPTTAPDTTPEPEQPTTPAETAPTAAPEQPLQATAMLATPLGIQANLTAPTAAQIAWEGVPGATGYMVHRNGVQIATVQGASYSDQGAEVQTYPNPLNCYAVQAYNDAGSVSDLSTEGCTSSIEAEYVLDVDGCLVSSNAETELSYFNGMYQSKTLVWNAANVTRNGDRYDAKKISMFFASENGTGCLKHGYHDYLLIAEPVLSAAYITPNPFTYSVAISNIVITYEGFDVDIGHFFSYNIDVINTGTVDALGIACKVDTITAIGSYAVGDNKLCVGGTTTVPNGMTSVDKAVDLTMWDGTVIESQTMTFTVP